MQNDNQKNIKQLILKTFILNIGLVLIAFCLALFLNFDFGFSFFLLGLLTTAVGLYLSGPKRYDGEIFSETSNQPVREYNKWLFHYLKTKAPSYGFENLLFYSGIMALTLSLPFICKLMYF